MHQFSSRDLCTIYSSSRPSTKSVARSITALVKRTAVITSCPATEIS